MGYSGDRYTRPGRIMSGPAPADCTEGRSMELRAAELHEANRRRSELFNRPVMADAAMDIMLTAFIADQQGSMLTRATAAMANRLHGARADAVIDDLIDARMLQRGERRDQIGLTPIGRDLMREFVKKGSSAACR